MKRYVAFLRAINVGGRRIKMDRLRAVFDEFGVSEVETYRASGNVVFTSDREGEELEERIERHLEDHLDFSVPTFVWTLSELEALSRTSEFPEPETGSRLKHYVVFLKEALTKDQKRRLARLDSDVDRFVPDGRALFWHRDVDAGKSIPTSRVESVLDVVATRRTMNTLERIVGTYG